MGRLDVPIHSHTLVFPDPNFYCLQENSLEFYVHTLHSDDNDDDDMLSADGHDSLFRTLELPNQCLDDKWDSFVFQELFKGITLRTLVRAISENGNSATARHLHNWQNIVMFDSPQGWVGTCLTPEFH